MLRLRTGISIGTMALAVLTLLRAFTLESVATYEAPPGVFRSIIYNNSATECALPSPRILDTEGRPVPVFWAMTEPERVGPGEYTFITFMPKSRDVVGPFQADTRGTAILLAPLTVPPLRVTYAVVQNAKLYVYIQNPSPRSHIVTALRVGTVSTSLANPMVLEPQAGNVLIADYAPTPGRAVAVPSVCVTLETGAGDSIPTFARLFQTEHTTMRLLTGTNDLAGCLTHRHPSVESGAESALEAILPNAHRLRTMKFCNMDLASGQDGPYFFAQLIERNHIEPQLARGDTGDMGELLRESERVKERSAPGMFYLWLFTSDIHTAGHPRYSLSHLRNTAYTSLAAGAKGVEVYPFEKETMDPAALGAVSALLAELEALQPLIANSEPVAIVTCDVPEAAAVRALLCGDRGILLFFIPLADQNGAAADRTIRVTATVHPPRPLAQDGVELGGEGETLLLEACPVGLAAKVELNDNPRIFYVPAKT